MPEEQQPESNRPAPVKGLVPHSRGRRGGRGRRRPVPVVSASGQSAPAEPASKQAEPPIRLREEMPVRPAPSKQKFQPSISAPIEPPKEKFRPAPRKNEPDISAMSQAVGEVTQVVESLRQSLEQMEEVLELVELAERQKLADEREIESLLRALRQLQSHGERTGRPERHSRPDRPNRPQRPEPQASPESAEHTEDQESPLND
jgi:hypothetical protein